MSHGSLLALFVGLMLIVCASYMARDAGRWCRPTNVRRVIGGRVYVVNATQAAMLDSARARQ